MIFVEVLSRRGEVSQRVRIDRLPATVGRGYGCDVIVSDPLVDAEHARLVMGDQGVVVLEDLGSRNGLFKDGARHRTDRLLIGGITLARIGHTQLRLVPGGVPVPAALPDTEAGDRLGRLLTTSRPATTIIVGGTALVAFWMWLSTFENRAVSVAGGETMGLLIASLAWSGLWALVGRASVQRLSFRPHLAASWLFLLLASVITALSSYAELLDPDGPFPGLLVVALLVLFAALLARHLAFATQLARRRRIAIASLITAGLVALVVLAGRIATDELDEGGTVRVAAQIKPFPARWLPARPLEPFLRTTNDLKKELDALPDRR